MYIKLGSSLRIRFEQNGNIDDLDKSIVHYTRAIRIEVTPKDHNDKPLLLKELGTAHRARYKHTGNEQDREQSDQYFDRSHRLTTGIQ